MWKKRALAYLVMCMAVFVLLLWRLADIGLISAKSYSNREINLLAGSVKQRSQEMMIDNGRGGFLDRNGESLQYKKMNVLILFPFLKSMSWDSERIANIIGVSKTALLQAVEKEQEPFVFRQSKILQLTERQMQEINDLRIPGVFAIEKSYPLPFSVAEQLIGITGENDSLAKKRYPDKEIQQGVIIGLTGLQKSFDEFLLSDGNAKLVYHVDGRGGPLFGIHVKYVDPANPFYPVNIVTTIDAKLQQLSEDLITRHGVNNGGLVLVDIESNSILAMVSRPHINKDAPFEEEGIRNMMLTEHIPGSVFKTVIAAAAIEQGLTDDSRKYDCNKTITGRDDLNYQHGWLTFSQSFALSCNNTFGTLANELQKKDNEIIERYAKKLSLLGTVGWSGDIYHMNNFKQFDLEHEGRIFLDKKERKDANYVAMTGIGQHEVRVTPLSVANMMATIARGGQSEMVRVASDIQYKNGTTLASFQQKTLVKEGIAPYTAMHLQKLLREVVTNEKGTGHSLEALPYSVAGKSGTAETGRYEEQHELINRWFAGYFPFEKPKYALVVVNLGVTGNEGAVTPIFSDMVSEIYAYNQNNDD